MKKFLLIAFFAAGTAVFAQGVDQQVLDQRNYKPKSEPLEVDYHDMQRFRDSVKIYSFLCSENESMHIDTLFAMVQKYLNNELGGGISKEQLDSTAAALQAYSNANDDVDDADNDPANEIQTFEETLIELNVLQSKRQIIAWDTLEISSGGELKLGGNALTLESYGPPVTIESKSASWVEVKDHLKVEGQVLPYSIVLPDGYIINDSSDVKGSGSPGSGGAKITPDIPITSSRMVLPSDSSANLVNKTTSIFTLTLSDGLGWRPGAISNLLSVNGGQQVLAAGTAILKVVQKDTAIQVNSDTIPTGGFIYYVGENGSGVDVYALFNSAESDGIDTSIFATKAALNAFIQQVLGAGYLTQVQSDASINGDGTSGSPLSVAPIDYGDILNPPPLVTGVSYNLSTDTLTVTKADGSTFKTYVPQGSGGSAIAVDTASITADRNFTSSDKNKNLINRTTTSRTLTLLTGLNWENYPVNILVPAGGDVIVNAGATILIGVNGDTIAADTVCYAATLYPIGPDTYFILNGACNQNSGGSGISSVSTDNTLTGDGSPGDPLGLPQAIPGKRIFEDLNANGESEIIAPGNTDKDQNGNFQFRINVQGELVVEKRVSGVWQQCTSFNY